MGFYVEAIQGVGDLKVSVMDKRILPFQSEATVTDSRSLYTSKVTFLEKLVRSTPYCNIS